MHFKQITRTGEGKKIYSHSPLNILVLNKSLPERVSVCYVFTAAWFLKAHWHLITLLRHYQEILVWGYTVGTKHSMTFTNCLYINSLIWFEALCQKEKNSLHPYRNRNSLGNILLTLLICLSKTMNFKILSRYLTF